MFVCLSVFLAERCNCIARFVNGIRCRLSVTLVFCDKRAEARIMQFSLKCSTMPYLFACQVLLRNSKGVPFIGGTNWGGLVSDFAMLHAYLGNGVG